MATKKKPTVLTDKFASPTDVALAQAQRYSIVSDNSGHEYFVKVEEVDDFYTWVEATDEDDEDIDIGKYDDNRIDGRFTFTDPRCE